MLPWESRGGGKGDKTCCLLDNFTHSEEKCERKEDNCQMGEKKKEPKMAGQTGAAMNRE